MRSFASTAAALAILVLSAGCSSAGDLPLGGPYGGDVSAGGSDAGAGSGTGTSTSSGVVVVVGSSGGTSTTTSTVSTGGNSSTATIGTSSSEAASTASTQQSSTQQSSTQQSSTQQSSTASTSSSSSSSAAPTWSYLYTTYLAAGSTIGDCDGSCHHHSQCSSATSCYSWIGNGNYDLGSSGDLFCWDSDGFMPVQCPSSLGNAVADFAAWIADGSKNN